jgi:hypothetical protein
MVRRAKEKALKTVTDGQTIETNHQGNTNRDLISAPRTAKYNHRSRASTEMMHFKKLRREAY